MKIFLTLILAPVLLFAQKDLTSRLDSYMQAQSEFQHFSGAVLLVRNDSILLKKGYGLADIEWNIPNTVDTKFRIGSNTKQFTAACILQLEQQGKLSLSDTLGKYFSGFEYGSKVTLHMLLTHSSGLQDYFHLKRFQGPLVGNHEFIPVFISKDSLVALMKTKLYDFLPGVDLHYSNTGYFLLGLIIERVSGKSYEDYLSEHIFKVAGMKNTGVDKYDTILKNRAKGYLISSGKTSNAFDQNYTTDLMFANGSLYSTIEDMYKWDKALYGTNILNDESKNKMFFPYGYAIEKIKKTADFETTTQAPMDPIWHHLGYGVWVDTFLTRQRIFSRGATSGFHSTIFRFPNNNCYVAVLQNNEENPDRIAESLSAIIFGAEFSLPYEHVPTAIKPEMLKKYTGKWVGNIFDAKWTTEILLKDGKLYRKIEGYPDIELIPESENKFFYADGQDKTFEFVKDKNGKVTHAWFSIYGIKFYRDRIK
jgi:CubicO group peptidase (beta-lactamase class C family)